MQRSKCSTCGELAEAHHYYYAHHNKQLTIQVKRLVDGKRLPGEREGKLWMWSRCGRCKPENGVPKSTKRVLISPPSRVLSLGKFLELSFSQTLSSIGLSSCGHSYPRDFLHFFGYMNFKLSYKSFIVYEGDSGFCTSENFILKCAFHSLRRLTIANILSIHECDYKLEIHILGLLEY